MSIMDMFKSKAAEPAPVKPVEPGNLPPVDPSKPAPEGNPAPAAEKEPTSPLEPFKDMWQPNVDSEGKPVTKEPAAPAPLDQKELQKVISQADFSKAISAEDLAAITAGGEGAAEALTKAMNSVAQSTMLQSTLATDKMIEQAIQATAKATEARVIEQIRKQNLSDNLLETNPLYSNPAVKPVMDAVQAQLSSKFPTASTSELATMAQDFIKAMGAELNPADVPAGDAKATADADQWNKFFDTPVS